MSRFWCNNKKWVRIRSSNRVSQTHFTQCIQKHCSMHIAMQQSDDCGVIACVQFAVHMQQVACNKGHPTKSPATVCPQNLLTSMKAFRGNKYSFPNFFCFFGKEGLIAQRYGINDKFQKFRLFKDFRVNSNIRYILYKKQIFFAKFLKIMNME